MPQKTEHQQKYELTKAMLRGFTNEQLAELTKLLESEQRRREQEA